MTTSLLAAVAQQTYSVNGHTGMAPPTTLGSVFRDMGVIAYPITFCALMVAVLSVRAILRLRAGGQGQASAVRSSVDGTLFWGAYAMVLGFLGTVLGIVVAAQAVQAVNTVEPALVWGGIKIALTSTVYGSLVFLLAALVWFGLCHWHRKTALSAA
jgi:MotA/TolQ/ExbB proton channel family